MDEDLCGVLHSMQWIMLMVYQILHEARVNEVGLTQNQETIILQNLITTL